MTLTSLASLAACRKDPPAPPPDPNAWTIEAAKLSPYLPPVLGPCSSTATAQTSRITHDQGGSDYQASRAYDCAGRVMNVSLHGGNLSAYRSKFDGRTPTAVESGESIFKDVMIGNGRGVVLVPNRGIGELDLSLPEHVVVVATLDKPSQPDELVPIMNKLDFKGLMTIDPHQVP